jgi:hypothetical protein
MKNILAVVVAVLGALIVAVPIYLIPLGIIFILFEDPRALFFLSVIYTCIFLIMLGIARLAENPRTKKLGEYIVILLVIAFVGISAVTYNSGACRQTRFIMCE